MSRDLRQYARQTNFRLLVGGILLLFVVGDGLIWIFYGPGAAVTGLLCMAAGISPLVLIGLVLKAMEWLVKRSDED